MEKRTVTPKAEGEKDTSKAKSKKQDPEKAAKVARATRETRGYKRV